MTARNDGPAGPGVPGDELLDVVVVGGSQAGLAIAWHLAKQNLRSVVLDAAPELGDTWRCRWDSLRLFTPAQYDGLPGMPFPGPPDTYPGKDAVAGYLKAYAAAFDLPVRLNSPVTRLSQTDVVPGIPAPYQLTLRVQLLHDVIVHRFIWAKSIIR